MRTKTTVRSQEDVVFCPILAKLEADIRSARYKDYFAVVKEGPKFLVINDERPVLGPGQALIALYKDGESQTIC